jgi:hypothetical protein
LPITATKVVRAGEVVVGASTVSLVPASRVEYGTSIPLRRGPYPCSASSVVPATIGAVCD